MPMSPESAEQQNWFDWAEAFLSNWKARGAERNGSTSPCADHVLKFATQAALSLNHDAVGAEHLLAGVLKCNSGRAHAVLEQAGLTLPALREEIVSARGIGAQSEIGRRIPYTPRCKGIIQRARAKVQGLGGARAEVDDLFLELLADKGGLPAQIFRRRAIDHEAIKSLLVMAPTEQ